MLRGMKGDNLSRRDFIAAAAATSATLILPSGVFAQGSDQLKVGVIGCGGRGSGAAWDAASADPGVVIWAMGDLFPDRLASSQNNLKELKDRYQVTPERSFVGFDAYQKVLASGVDIVILASPPGFRPTHFAAAVEAGKHIFTEKPIATDSTGVRTFLEASRVAAAKGLSIVAGTQRRHDVAYRECMARIHGGQIGEITACYAYWNQGALWSVPKSGAMTDVEWQIRNWLYFTWLSGDHIVEQHVHNLDVCNWAMGRHPVRAFSLAGRQVRTDPVFGHIFDHFATEYEYDNGVRLISMCRQIDNTANRVAERVVGTKGATDCNTRIKGVRPWRWSGERESPYLLEHKHLIAAIRSGKRIDDSRDVAESTLTAIMGRMAAYSGQQVTWEQAMYSTEDLVPKDLEFGPMPVPPVALPGAKKPQGRPA